MKFNNALLYDKEFIANIKTCIADCIEQYKIFDSEDREETEFSILDQLFWETLKLMIRGKTISYSSFKKKERNREEGALELHLNSNENIKEKGEEFSRIERQLRSLRESRIKGA